MDCSSELSAMLGHNSKSRLGLLTQQHKKRVR
jgi:hypothetical protein